MRSFLLLVASLSAVGCGTNSTIPATHRDDTPHGHSHERGTVMLADVGPYHAGLTAHLSSKTGNELDIVIETADEAHQPIALPLAKLMAKAKTAEGQEHALEFEPSEPDERKDDPPGKCSRFTAKAAWMKPTDRLTVTAAIEVAGKPHTAEWKDFNPKKYAHFEE